MTSENKIASPVKSESNKDLLLCENPYFLEKSKLSSKLNFGVDKDDKKGKTLKTERITSSVLSQVKGFLELVKTNDPKCVNIEENDHEESTEEDGDHEMEPKSCDTETTGTNKQDIELNLLLFPRNDNDDDEDSSDSDSEDEPVETGSEVSPRKMAEIIE